MRIKNQYTEKIEWNAFKGDDTVYATALKIGTIENNKEDSWRDDSFPDIKIEIKKHGGDIFNNVLAKPGQSFKMTDNLIFNQQKKLEVAKVSMTKTGQSSQQKSDIQFVDLRNFDSNVERTVISKIENAFSTSEGLDRSHEHSQTWSVGALIGGTIGEKDVLSGNAEITGGFEDKVVNSLQNTYGKTVSSVWSQSWTDKLSFKAGMIYVLEIVWLVKLQEGSIAYWGEIMPYSVVQSASASLMKPSQFASVEEMPAKYKEQWDLVKPA